MKKNLLKSTFTVSLMTILSRVTGFIRDLIFAHVFGAGASLDAFLVAFRIPNFLRRLFAEGAFSQAFIPVLSDYRQNHNEDETHAFVNRMAGAMITVLFLVTLLAIIITPWLVYLFAPGFVHDPSRYALATSMLRITFPYLLFISLAALAGGILNTYGKFSVPAFTPCLLNIILMGAAIWLAPHFAEPIIALSWGIFVGGVVQLGFQLPFLHKLNLLPKPQLLWRDEGVRRVMKLMLPATFGVSVAQLGVFIDTLFASFLHTGSLSWLYYSDRLTSFPLGVFGVAIATVVLPHLSRKHAAKSSEEFSAALDWALRFVLVIGLPAAVAIILLSGPILATLFEYGKFTHFDVIMARRSLLGFAIGVPAFMLVKVLASGFYSRQNIKTPVKIAAIAVVSNAILDAILIFPLAHAGLALATSLATFLNAGLLFFTLRHFQYYQPRKGWAKYASGLLFANIVMALVIWFSTANLSQWLIWGWSTKVGHLTAICSAAILSYLICLWVARVKWREFIFVE